MARKRLRPITIPDKVKIERHGSRLKITGPLGTNEVQLIPRVTVEMAKDSLRVVAGDETRETAAQQGTQRTLIANAIDGVVKGFTKTLVVQGTGYRAQLGGGGIQLFVGYTKPVTIPFPKGITCELSTVKSADKGDLTFITLKGTDRQQVGDCAAQLRGTRDPDPYRHKGLRYANEVLRKKVGKRAVVQAT